MFNVLLLFYGITVVLHDGSTCHGKAIFIHHTQT